MTNDYTTVMQASSTRKMVELEEMKKKAPDEPPTQEVLVGSLPGPTAAAT